MINELITFKFEIVSLASILLLLFVSMYGKEQKNFKHFVFVLILAAINFLIYWIPTSAMSPLLSNILDFNNQTNFLKCITHFGSFLVILASYQWFRQSSQELEFYIFIFSAVLGIDIIISAHHLLIFYIGLELLSISLIFLCTFNFKERKSSEAALKLFLINIIATGFILYGISVLYLYHAPMNMYQFLNQPFTQDAFFTLNIIFIIAGFAFKLAIVPFHLWAADVYADAPTPVTNFIITVPKIAYIVFIVKLTQFNLPLSKNQELYVSLISLFAVFSICIGNIFALRTSEIKRFLAFSSISQMGYILFGILTINSTAMTNFIFFMLGYMIVNFVIFTIINIAETKYHIKHWEQLRGLYYSHRFTGVALLISLISLAGIPPTIGFFSKFYLILNSQFYNIWVLVIVLINLIISIWYYFHIIKLIFSSKVSIIEDAHFSYFPFEKFSIQVGLILIVILGLFPCFYNYIIQNL